MQAKDALPAYRTVTTPQGVINYFLAKKKVRNLNLRVKPDGTVAVSAPAYMPKRQIDSFVAERAGWIAKALQWARTRPPAAPCRYTRKECMELFAPLMEAVFPLFSSALNGQRPVLKVREMKSRWGSCNVKTRTITLNARLAEKPRAAQEYVVLHEYVHFIHPNHQAAFHAEMARLMPDYRQRRAALRE